MDELIGWLVSGMDGCLLERSIGIAVANESLLN